MRVICGEEAKGCVVWKKKMFLRQWVCLILNLTRGWGEEKMTQEIFKLLNLSQREAVTYKDGPLLIVAGAGSGKDAPCSISSGKRH